MDNKRDAETGHVHCGKCNKRLDWNMDRNAFNECSCAAKPSPEDQLDQLKMVTVKNLKPVPTVANLTLRDWFAGQALMGLLASRNPTSPRFHPDDDAQYVHAVADAMLAAREVKP